MKGGFKLNVWCWDVSVCVCVAASGPTRLDVARSSHRGSSLACFQRRTAWTARVPYAGACRERERVCGRALSGTRALQLRNAREARGGKKKSSRDEHGVLEGPQRGLIVLFSKVYIQENVCTSYTSPKMVKNRPETRFSGKREGRKTVNRSFSVFFLNFG